MDRTMIDQNQAELAQRLSKMILGGFISQMIQAAAELGLADRLIDGPKKADRLAAEIGADVNSLRRLLRTLISLGLFSRSKAGAYKLNPLAELLTSNHPLTQRHLARFMGASYHVRAWTGLAEAIKTGQPAFDAAFGCNLVDYLAEHNEDRAVFDACMAASTAAVVEQIVSAYDFGRFGSIVDVGGGHPVLLEFVIHLYPQIRGILFDRPEVIAGLEERGCVTAGLVMIGGDFFQSVPDGAELYIAKRVIHDWPDEQAIAILSNCRRAMAESGMLLLIENLIEDDDKPSLAKMADIEMLVVGGRERTAEEYEGLLTKAGFRLTEIIPTVEGSLIEAAPVP